MTLQDFPMLHFFSANYFNRTCTKGKGHISILSALTPQNYLHLTVKVLIPVFPHFYFLMSPTESDTV